MAKTQIHIQVDESQKRKWEQAANESPGVGSLSGLIRSAVESHIQEDERDSQTADATVDTSELETQYKRIQKRLRGIEGTIDSIETEVSQEPDLTELADDVFEILPDEKPGSRAWKDEEKNRVTQLQAAEVGEEDIPVDMAEKHRYAWEGTVGGLAKALDEPEYRMEDAVDKLRSEMRALVKTIEYDGKTRYYRRE